MLIDELVCLQLCEKLRLELPPLAPTSQSSLQWDRADSVSLLSLVDRESMQVCMLMHVCEHMHACRCVCIHACV